MIKEYTEQVRAKLNTGDIILLWESTTLSPLVDLETPADFAQKRNIQLSEGVLGPEVFLKMEVA